MLYLQQVLNGEVFVDLNFHLNFVDARDVAAGMIAAAHQGRPGERYLLATRTPVSNRRVIELAREFNPDVRVPGKAPKALLTAIAMFMELGGRITGIEPKLVRSQVEILYGTSREMDITKAQNELDFEPRDPESAIRESFDYLMNWEDSSTS
jgi:dihydroflavonol-4-reductase